MATPDTTPKSRSNPAEDVSSNVWGGHFFIADCEDRWLHQRFFPDLDQVLPPLSGGQACAENKAYAALRVWLKVWYMPPITYMLKHPDRGQITWRRYRVT